MEYTRRSLLLASAGTIAVAGCLDGAADDPANGGETEPDDDEPDADDTETETNGDDGDSADGTNGEDDAGRATVAVGADGEFRFDPETLEIDSGTVVEFVWEASHHNIAVTDQPDGGDWNGVLDTQNEGFTHEHTFEIEGRYEYICEPHESSGMRGTVLVGDVEPADGGEDGGGSDDDGDSGGPGYGY